MNLKFHSIEFKICTTLKAYFFTFSTIAVIFGQADNQNAEDGTKVHTKLMGNVGEI